ncbi:MAG: TRCF domain-containing protein, partial [Rudaea sp.]
GHIAAVGFDLYCRLLQRAVEDQRAALGTGARDKTMVAAGDGDVLQAPNIELPLEAQIPEDYVGDASLRLRLYRRMADVLKSPQVDEIGHEFQDRFGPPPEPVKNLLYLLRVKLAARAANVAAINMDDGQVLVRFRSEDRERMNRLTGRYAGRVRVALDRFWLAGPDADPYWDRRLIEAVQFAASPGENS